MSITSVGRSAARAGGSKSAAAAATPRVRDPDHDRAHSHGPNIVNGTFVAGCPSGAEWQFRSCKPAGSMRTGLPTTPAGQTSAVLPRRTDACSIKIPDRRTARRIPSDSAVAESTNGQPAYPQRQVNYSEWQPRKAHGCVWLLMRPLPSDGDQKRPQGPNSISTNGELGPRGVDRYCCGAGPRIGDPRLDSP